MDLFDRVIMVDSSDSVAVVVKKLKENEEFSFKNESFVVREDIEPGFKVALNDISKKEKIIKYGEVIGQATQEIKRGEIVHTHNVEGLRGRGDRKGDIQ